MCTNNISPGQIKAARALLDWTQDDLAISAGLSIATVRKIELGFVSPRLSTMSGMRKTLESAGIEFTDADGIRRRQENVGFFEGLQGCAAFLRDVEAQASREGGDFCLVAPSTQKCGFGGNISFFQRVEEMVDHNHLLFAKILLLDSADLPLSALRFEYRSISSSYVDAMPFCVIGDRYAYVNLQDQKIITVQSRSAACASKKLFLSMWDKALFATRCSFG